jgi:hypothetical protein
LPAQPKGPGRPPGSKNKRTLEGESFAKDILSQNEEDLVRDESGKVIQDNHPLALVDPVFRNLRAQVRTGVGNIGGMMPPAVLVALADRAWGKVTDRVKIKQAAAKAYQGETDEALAKRAAELAKDLGIAQEGGEAL